MRRLSGLRRMLGMWTRCALVCALVLASSNALADGAGIKLGDHLLLHLGVGTEFRYDDNAFLQDNSKTDAFEFRLLASVDLATRNARNASPSKVDFRLHAGMTYNEFISNRAVLAQHRDVAVDAGALVTINPAGRYNLALFDNFVRSTQLPYSNEPYNLDRDSNQLGIRGQAAPGGGRLVLGLSYVFGLDFFEVDQLKDFNTLSHTFALNVSWKFFPKTALYLAASETIIQYQQHVNFDHPDSYPFHVELGVTGLITPKLSVNAYIGYGNGFYVSGPSPNTAVGGLSLSWKPTLMSSGSIGYKYDFTNALLGSYQNNHQVFITWAQLIWRFTAGATLGYQNIQYHGTDLGTQGVVTGPPPAPPAMAAPVTERTDNYVSFDLRLDYPFKPWLSLGAGYDLRYNVTPTQLSGGTNNAGMPVLLPANYLANEVWLRLAAQY
jgi:hypothetical protein